MSAVAPSLHSPQRSIGRGTSPIGIEHVRKHGGRVAILTGPAAQEAQDRERRRLDEDWSGEDTQCRGAGEMVTIFDIKDNTRGRILVLWPKVRSGLKPRLPGNW